MNRTFTSLRGCCISIFTTHASRQKLYVHDISLDLRRHKSPDCTRRIGAGPTGAHDEKVHEMDRVVLLLLPAPPCGLGLSNGGQDDCWDDGARKELVPS
jgi:hypothetical protein